MQETKPSPTLADLLGVLLENKGSDLHVQSGEVPIGRINGELGRFEMPPLTESDVLRLAREVLGSDEKMQEFQATKDCDAAIAIPNLGRFRVNLFYQRNRPGLVLRTIGTKIPTIEQLELPEVLKTIAAANDGLVLVTGATGSGKSTTLAALIDHINATEACHIMTLEDPIEFVHENKLALINQREISVDSSTFASALKHVLRQDPDVILIGEMRDAESASVALTAAETGHLVFGTLHTQDAPESLERLINLFPTDRIAQVRMQLSLGLRAIICQKLLPRAGWRTDGRRGDSDQQPAHQEAHPGRRHHEDPRGDPIVAVGRDADVQPGSGGPGEGRQGGRGGGVAVLAQTRRVEDESQGDLFRHLGYGMNETQPVLRPTRSRRIRRFAMTVY